MHKRVLYVKLLILMKRSSHLYNSRKYHQTAYERGFGEGRAAGLEEAAGIALEQRCERISAVTVEQSPLPDLTAITELRRYCAQRGKENEKRAITAYGAEASWHSAKADTYQRIETKLSEILAAPPITGDETKEE